MQSERNIQSVCTCVCWTVKKEQNERSVLEHARFFVDMCMQEVQANKKVSHVSSYLSVDYLSAQRRSEGGAVMFPESHIIMGTLLRTTTLSDSCVF